MSLLVFPQNSRAHKSSLPPKLTILAYFPLWTPHAPRQVQRQLLHSPFTLSSTMLPFCTMVNALSLPNTIPVPHTTTLHYRGGEPYSFSVSPNPMFSSLPSFSA